MNSDQHARYTVGQHSDHAPGRIEAHAPLQSSDSEDGYMDQAAVADSALQWHESADNHLPRVQIHAGSSMAFVERVQGSHALTLPASSDRLVFDPAGRAPPYLTSAGTANNDGGNAGVETNGHPKRNVSVSDRSPLQNLEAKLGDISKEEKRARAEDAEQRARQRASLGNNTASAPAPARPSSQTVHRKPVPRECATQNRIDGSPPRANSPRVDVAYKTQDKSDEHNSVSEKPRIAVANDQSNQREPPGSYASTRSRGRGYGHDASLTGGAAAAAVDAYQAVRRRQYTEMDARRSSTTMDNSPTLANFRQQQNLSRAQDTEAYASQNSRDVANRKPEPVQTGGYDGKDGDMNQKKDQRFPQKRITNKSTSNGEHKDPAETTAMYGTKIPSHEQPLFVATGPGSREAMASEVNNPNDVAPHKHHDSNHRRIHFSDIIEHDGHSERRYVAPKTLEEWKNAETAILEEVDFDLRTPRQGAVPRRSADRSSSSGAEVLHDYRKEPNSGLHTSRPQSTFRPMLMLRCGPLLRYAGIRTASAGSREFWRGTVMIVTEDATSMYKPRPTLKIFKQHMELLPPPPLRIDGETGQQLAPEYIDPLAGQATLSRTGQTLYVRPVHHLPAETDLSLVESNDGLFEQTSTAEDDTQTPPRISRTDGLSAGRYREVKGFRLHAERGVTFWRFNIQAELGTEQRRVAYTINNGPAVGFWLPARGQMMNVMFHSCNGFSMNVDANLFSGPDPMWRDVLNTHQIRPFHCMIGGGDQIYNDAAMRDTEHFKSWLGTKNPIHKHSAAFTSEMQEELEQFYLDRYSMWFSQGLFGMANSQIPMVNIWDDHDIIDGFGSYPHHFMAAPVFAGLGAVAFKYYMLFQHQSLPDEDGQAEPSWLLGAYPGPYINQLSRSLFISLGRNVILLGLDCRTERMHDEVLSQETYDIVFDRCRREITRGQTKHLIVLLGVPIAYPRLNWLENVLTSRVMEPFKALGRMGMLSNFVNKFDGGVEILDDLDDHWTAKHHKQERNWFIQELQELAAEKSVRVTILGGDVHLGAMGQFYSNPKLSVPKDRDHRYMPNVISSAIVNAPPPEMMADIMNRRNKVHHLDQDTDEDMIPIFTHDVDGKARKNLHLLPRRNWCSLREYVPAAAHRSSPSPNEVAAQNRPGLPISRSTSLTRRDPQRGNLLRRLSSRQAPPPSAYRSDGTATNTDGLDPRVDGPSRQAESEPSHGMTRGRQNAESTGDLDRRQDSFHRRTTSLSRRSSYKDKSGRDGHIDLQGGIEVTINCEVDQKDPAGVTIPYSLLIPALFYHDKADTNMVDMRSRATKISNFLGVGRNKSSYQHSITPGDEQSELYNGPDQSYDTRQDKEISLDGQDERTNGQVSNSSGYALRAPLLSAQGHDRSRSEEGNQTTASLQRASIESERTQPTESTISRLPRSQAPDEGQAFFRRHSSKARTNIAHGPPPPSNIDQLPASVQKRYHQLNDAVPPQSDRSNSPDTYSQYATPNSERPSQARHSVRDQLMPSAFMPAEQDRHYSGGAMESPLLPVNANQIRSGNKRTNFDPLLVGSSSTMTQDHSSVPRRIVSGPPAFATRPRSTMSTMDQREDLQRSDSAAQSTNFQPSKHPYRPRQGTSTSDGSNRNSTYLEYGVEGPMQRQNIHSNHDESAAESPILQELQAQRRQKDNPGWHYSNSDDATPPQSSAGRGLGVYDPSLDQRSSNRHRVVYDNMDIDDSTSLGDADSVVDRHGRPGRSKYSSGIPDKVVRHFGGYNEVEGRGAVTESSLAAPTRPGGGLSGLVRRLSEGGKDSKRTWKVW